MAEDELETAWKTWKANPNPAASGQMLTKLDPLITRAANAHAGRMDPVIKGRARSMTLDALHSYDPAKGRLGTHVYGQLQGLKRYAAQTASGIHVPERVVLDRRAVTAAASGLQDELGREPTETELADRSGFSIRRIRYVQNANQAQSEGFLSGLHGDEGEDGGLDPSVRIPGADSGRAAWEQLVVEDLPPVDQKIYEYQRQGMSNQAIAAKLRYSPGYVSQRKLVIQRQLDQQDTLNPF